MRVLVSEGSSLSAREIITALGMAGHHVGVCDPNAICLGRFSRFVTHFYRCPPFGRDPWGYLDFILHLAASGEWDVLFPAHEQAFLFARARERFPASLGVAVASFDSFLQIQGKAALVRTLSRLGLPQPAWRVIRTREELESESRFPVHLKADYTTASKAVWRIDSAAALSATIPELRSRGLLDGREEFVVQEHSEGALERVLAVFDRGTLAAVHGYRQLRAGPGGGDVAKLSVLRSGVNRHIQRLGGELRWHGALSMDYILRDKRHPPLFIDANPRLVEPMNGVLSGVNLADAVVRVSLGQTPVPRAPGPRDVRTHLLLMGLLTAASAGGRRRDVAAELFRAAAGRGIYAGSREELLPILTDLKSLIPLGYVLARLLFDAASSEALSAGSIASYSMSAEAARQIAGPPPSPR
jgi:predicted ATP-grasp superfamily ATP-dependent carboligase